MIPKGYDNNCIMSLSGENGPMQNRVIKVFGKNELGITTIMSMKGL